jgi:phosphatidylserine decarboxylase
MIIVKGIQYDINEFLMTNDYGKYKLNEDTFMTQYILYLSPKNYHRFHAPVDLIVDEVKHYKGNK